MNEVTVFTNSKLKAELRTIVNGSELWFVAKDVASALNYSNTDQAVRQHCKKVKTCPLEINGQVRHLKIIPESDLYRLIIRSNKAEAEAFQDWVTEEVLPSIRKIGSYSHTDEDIALILARKIIDQAKRIESLEAQERIFGNRTPFGELSEATGCPKQFPVRGYLRSNRRVKRITVTEEYDLFANLEEGDE